MKHEPARFLRHTQSAVNLIRTDTIFAIDEHPQCCKPFVQSERRVLEDSADFDRELALARLALPASLCCQIVVLFMAALRAGWSFRPAQSGYGIDADLLITEVADGLLKRLGLFHAQIIAFPVWLVKYIMSKNTVSVFRSHVKTSKPKAPALKAAALRLNLETKARRERPGVKV